MPTDPNRVQDVFLAALEQGTAERAALLVDRECGEDKDLRQRVETLLKAHDEPGSFLDSPACGVDAFPTIDQPITEGPGSRIGRYKLLQEIGEGGMGVVYMAEQQEPVLRKVALKIIKPGMDTRQVIARFEAERQALALMNHPNIAQVLDAAATESGRPYFVMELVHGIPITDYCDQNRLTTGERLELFVKVCQAVQHAHQKGIIHRDLKPTNVMITLHDGEPVPKIIDFGVAKATNQRLTEKTAFTHYGQMIGTPLYMSPEQAELSGLDVDTRTDIYSLGVLLYELMAGVTPFEKERLQQAAYDEMCSIICQEEPPRPSARISTMGAAATTVSAHRKTEPGKLSSLLRGELDWIVLKALEKDRTRRYETANAFARDVQRHLDDEAVEACPPSAAYQLRKFASRNKTALVTTAVVVLALIAGAGVATWQAILATQAQRTSDRQYTRAEANLQLARNALDEVYIQLAEEQLPQKVQLDQQDQRFLEQALPFYEEIAKQKGSDPNTLAATAQACLRVGDIHNKLEQPQKAEEAYRRSITLSEQLSVDFPPVSEYRTLLADAQLGLGAVLQSSERDEQAQQVYHQALEHCEKLADDFPSEGNYRRQLALCYRGLASVLGNSRSEEAEPYYRRCIDVYRELVDEFPEQPSYRRELTWVLNLHGDLLRQMGRLEESEEAYVKVGERFDDYLAMSLDPQIGVQPVGSLVTSAMVKGVTRSGRCEDAEDAYRVALGFIEKLVADHPDTPSYRYELAETLTDLGDLLMADSERMEEAEKCYQRAVRLLETLVEWWPDAGSYRAELTSALTSYGGLLAQMGRFDEAEQTYRRTLESSKKIPSELLHGNRNYIQFIGNKAVGSSCSTVGAQLMLGDLLKRAGRDAEAAGLWREALEQSPDACVDYTVRIQTPGLYRLYLRWSGHDSESNAVNARIVGLADGPGGEVCDWWQFAGYDDGDFATNPWAGAAGFEMAHMKFFAEPAVWRISAPGDYTIRFSVGELGAALDAFVFQLASLPSPRGDGPAESKTTEDRVFLESDGRVVAEAEHFTRRAAGVRGNHWLAVPDEEVGDGTYENPRGKGYLQVLPDDGGNVASIRRALMPDRTRVGWDLERYSRLIEANPGDAELFYQRGRAYEQLDQTEEAEADWRRGLDLLSQAITENAEDSEAYRLRARIHKTLKDYQAAVEDYSKLIQLTSGDFALWTLRASAHRELEQWDDAIADYSEALELSPRNSGVYCNRAWARTQTGDREGAIRDYTEYLKLQPRNATAYNNRGYNYGKLGRHDEALADYGEALKIDPKLSASYNNRGALYARLKQYELARDNYFREAEADPKNASTINTVAWRFATGPAETRDSQRAVELAKRAVELAPQQGAYWNTLGAAQYRAGNWHGAIEAMTKSAELRSGGDSFDFFFLAMAYWQLDDQQEARDFYRQAIRSTLSKASNSDDSGSPTEAKAFRAEAEELMGLTEEDQYTVSAEYFQEAIRSNPEDLDIVEQLADCHHRLAHFARDGGRLQEAEQHYRDAVKLLGRLCDRTPESNNSGLWLCGHPAMALSITPEAALAGDTLIQRDFSVDLLADASSSEDCETVFHQALTHYRFRVKPLTVDPAWKMTRVVFLRGARAAHYNPRDGRVYVGTAFTDSDGLYAIDADGKITKIADGHLITGVAVDPDEGHVFFSEAGGKIYRSALGGVGRALWVSGFKDTDSDPEGMAFATQGFDGDVVAPGQGLVVDRGYYGRDEVYRFSAAVPEQEVLLHSDAAGEGPLIDPSDVTIGASGVYLVDGGTSSVYRLDGDGSLTPVGTDESFEHPVGIATDPITGDLFIVDSGRRQLLRVNPETGAVSQIVTGFFKLDRVCVDVAPEGDRVFITDTGSHAILTFTLLTAADEYAKAIEQRPDDPFLRLRRARFWTRRGDLEQALEDYNKAVELAPDNPALWMQRARFHAAQDRPEQALADIDKVVELGPDNPALWMQRARFHAAQDRPEQALADIDKVVELAPEDWTSLSARGDLQQQLGQWDKAISDYRRAMELAPGQWAYWKTRVDALKARGQPDRADDLYTALVKLMPDDWRPWQALADAYGQSKQWEKQAEALSHVIKLNPSVPPRRYNQRSICYCRLGDFERALLDSNKAIEIDPNQTWLYSQRAWVHIGLGDYEQAITDCDEALRLTPHYLGALSRRSQAREKLGDLDGALADAAEVIRIRLAKDPPSAAGAYVERARMLARLSRWTEVIADYDEVLRLDPRNRGALFQRSLAREKLGDLEGALADVAEAIRLDPQSFEAYMRRAEIYVALDQWSDAIADYAQAAELKPNDPQPLCLHTSVLLLAGDTKGYQQKCEQTLQHFDGTRDVRAANWTARICTLASNAVADPLRVVQLLEPLVTAGDSNSFRLYALGKAHYRAGQLDQAVERFQQSLQATPPWKAEVLTWLALAMAYHQRGDEEQARTWLNKALKWTEQHELEPQSRSTGPGDGPLPFLFDSIEYIILFREARQLIGPSPAPNSDSQVEALPEQQPVETGQPPAD